MNRRKNKIMSQHQALDCGNECDLCHGSGWIVHEREATPEEYKNEVKINEAIPCTKCKGDRRNAEATGIPAEFCETDISKFNFGAYSTANMEKVKKVVDSFVNQGKKWQETSKGLYLWSKTPGSGKTFLACSMARTLMLKFGWQMRFITAPDYISAVGDFIKSERGTRDTSAVYRECQLLVLDDIGTQMGKEWHQSEMFRLINHRLSNGLVTIFTSNSPLEQLNLDSRLKSRIKDAALILQMPEESIRDQKSQKEQEEFLVEILKES